MHPVNRLRAVRAGGFTMIEMMVVIAILAITMGIGIPSMSAWLMSNKAAGANEFYMEGFRAARQQAISHNALSRLMLTTNNTTGQKDWQVDICFPANGACAVDSTNWSTPSSAAPGDPETGSPYTSLKRTADVLPSDRILAPSTVPANAYAVYYTALGWVDTTVPNNIQLLKLDPAPAYVAQLPTSAISITLAGMPIRCNADAASGDSRKCP
jgi:type IV fimbrial biogenesis protein FimT